MKHYVFAYGTLKHGYRNHNFLKDSTFICEALVEGFYMFDLGSYPGIYEGEGKIYGELYEIDAATLAKMDYLEEEGSLYIRKSIKVNNLNVWIYVYNKNVDNIIKIEKY
ncbi:MAG: gamma-glutamylcyclotransferase [Erysipelotrichaceae bacterium]|nr:gamma-glutamylcyclotransferase [Erysipelotrichaceae bacterium]